MQIRFGVLFASLLCHFALIASSIDFSSNPTIFTDGELIELNGCSGTIQSTGFPGEYPNSVSAEIRITSDGGTPIRITTTSFQMEGCCDFLRAYDGADANAPLIGQWNGTALLPGDLFESSGGVMFLQFTTDGSVTFPGFELEWQCLTPMAPIADFSSPNEISCNGVVSFTDESDFIPTSWEWDFGDGNSSTEQNPVHTYALNGTYSVSLTACNDLGCNTKTTENFILVDPENAVCFETFFQDGESIQIAGCTGTIYSPDFPNSYPNSVNSEIQITSSDGTPIRLTVNSFELEGCCDFLRAYDGADANAPLIGQWNGMALVNGDQIQSTGDVMFLRFTSDGSVSLPGFEISWQCLTPMAPIVDFSSESAVTCDGAINFQDESDFIPTSWDWDFGDGNSSTDQNPTHTYAETGTYTVSLTACNDLGCNTITFEDYILFDPEDAFCFQTIFEDDANVEISGCGGTILSPNFPAEYPNGVNSSIQITSMGGGVSLTVNSFQLEGCCDFLRAYDGPDANATLIGEWNGSALASGDVIESMSSVMFLTFSSDGSGTFPGFNLTWGCTANINNVLLDHQASPICPATVTFVALEGIDSYEYVWDFGDGYTATGPGPHEHTYPTAGTFNATLAVTDETGTANSSTMVNINSPNIALDIIGPDTVLINQVVTYTKGGSDLLNTFTWREDNGSPVMGTEYTTSWDALGTHMLRLDAGSDKVCSGSTMKLVEVVLTSDIADANAVNKLSVFPNPTNGMLYFQLETAVQTDIIHYAIFDAFGRQLQNAQVEQPSNGTPVGIDLNRLPKASYLIVLTNADGTRLATRRFVKQ